MPEAAIEIRTPRRLTSRAVAIILAYGLFLMIPVLAAIQIASVLKLGMLTWALPLASIAFTLFILPFGFGNPYAAGLVKAALGGNGVPREGFVVQLTLTPRLRHGWRALLEDADDLGCLTIGETEVVYRGDAVSLTLPYTRMERVAARNIGWRGLFLYGSRVVITSREWPNIEAVEFAERGSCLLPASRRVARELYDRISAGAKRAGQATTTS